MRSLPFVISIFIVLCMGLDEDPEIYMDAAQIIERWGYTAEKHFATTEDGYLLGLHRIPFGKNGASNGNKRPVVFMQHGLLCSSTNWIANLPNESAGFMFADAGFDVWLGNMRGNTYSKGHTTIPDSDERYWEFSADEMQQYDLPAMINYVLNVTGEENLYYIGHSQGTLTMFEKLSEDQTFHNKIKMFFALAPIGTVKHVEGAFGFLAKYFTPELDFWYHEFGSGEFIPSTGIMKLISQFVCGDKKTDPLCDNILFLIAGPESSQFNETRTAVYTSHTPAGTSTQNVVHWMQMVKSGKVQKMDFGAQNQQHYGQSSPPLYDYSKVNTPVYLYWSDDDDLGDKEDIEEYLLKQLKTIVMNNHLPHYNHLDFIWGLNAPRDIYEPIIEIIKKDLN